MKLHSMLLDKIKIVFLCFLFFQTFKSHALTIWCPDINIAMRGGVAPTFWNERDQFIAVSCALNSSSPYVPLFKMPKFSKLFGTPWFIGFQLGYPLCAEQEVYFEVNYRQSKGRTFSINPLMIASADIAMFSMTPTHYGVIDSYIGFRGYKKNCWCAGLDLFIGGKVGLAHHAKTNFTFITASLIVPPEVPFVSASLPLFFSNTVPAVGANLGIAYEVGCNFDLLVMTELIANCGPRSNQNIPFATQSDLINPVLEPNSFIIGNIGTEIIIPITIGLKYKF